MANDQATKARKRIQTTTICSGWDGVTSSSVTMACPDNAGLAQHDIKVLPSAPVSDTGGAALVWIRPVDCAYFVRLGYLRLSVGEMVFRGMFDAVRLDVATAWPGVTVTATVSSIGTTYNSSASEGNETHWRRRYVRTTVASGWNGQSTITKQIVDHAPLSQHMVSIGGAVGSVQVFGSLDNDPFVPLGSLDASGEFLICTGYYDRIMLSPTISSGSATADVHSIAQELIVDDADTAPGSPMLTKDGDVDVVPEGRQMLWSVSGSVSGNGSLEIDGAFVEQSTPAQLVQQSAFTSSGNFTVPENVTMIYVSACAGGGGGAGSMSTGATAQTCGAGGGGGAGQAVSRMPLSVTPLSVLAITVGIAGQGGTAPPAGLNPGGSGLSGGTTSIGTLLSLTAGQGGVPPGVTFSSGGPGGQGFPYGQYGADGTGGAKGGNGASSLFGTGGFGGRGALGTGTVAGTAASGYGAGGGGAGGTYGSTANTNGSAGANGSPGYVLIEW